MLNELSRLQVIGYAPCYRSIDNFYNDSLLTPILDYLILLTALPLASVEDTVAIDSTGFGVSKYQSWQLRKWGSIQQQETKRRVFRKLHAMVGCKTNVFLSAEITTSSVSDITMLKTVVGKRITYFDLNTFVADKAYSSREVYKFLHKLGLRTYIPFKRGSSSTSRGAPHWKEMFNEFFHHNEEYRPIYHQRSNVESTFHMVKQRFGHSLWTKTLQANVNELKARVLCHNICVLIQETAELGINLDFTACEKILRPVKK
jgi:transposase